MEPERSETYEDQIGSRVKVVLWPASGQTDDLAVKHISPDGQRLGRYKFKVSGEGPDRIARFQETKETKRPPAEVIAGVHNFGLPTENVGGSEFLEGQSPAEKLREAEDLFFDLADRYEGEYILEWGLNILGGLSRMFALTLKTYDEKGRDEFERIVDEHTEKIDPMVEGDDPEEQTMVEILSWAMAQGRGGFESAEALWGMLDTLEAGMEPADDDDSPPGFK